MIQVTPPFWMKGNGKAGTEGWHKLEVVRIPGNTTISLIKCNEVNE